MRSNCFLLLGLIFLLLVSVSFAYTIENDVVSYENSYAKLEVYPHTAYNPTNTNYKQFFRLTKKVSGTHDIYVGYSFDAPIRNGKVFYLNNGVWQNVTNLFMHTEYNGRHYYHLQNTITFTDANPTKTWKVIYTPTGTETKWDLHFWKDDNRDDFFGGIVDLNVLLDPWFHDSANTRIPITINPSVSYDTNTTWFIKDWDSSSYSGNNSRLWLVRQDTNEALDIDIEGVFGTSTDLNIAFRVPDYIFPLATNTIGEDTNGLMLYIENLDIEESIYKQYRDLNEVYWFGDNFDVNTLKQDYSIQTDANWNDKGFIRATGTQAQDFISRNIGISSPTNIIIQSRQRSNSATQGGGVCLNAEANPALEKAHCLKARDGSYRFMEPNVGAKQDTGISPIADTWFTYLMIEHTDANTAGTVVNTNTADMNTSNLMASSNYENYNLTKEATFTDYSNIHFSIVSSSNGLAQIDVDWFKVFKFVTPPTITLGSGESAGKLKLTFKDENTGTLINPSHLTLSINDSDANSWSANVVNGQLDINIAHFNSGKWTFVFGDASHSNRTFMYNINNASNNSYGFTLGMLNDVNGTNIDFKFYNQIGTSLLVDANVEVRDSTGRIAERKTLNSAGETTFYLNPNDAGYQFNINDVNGSDYNYTATIVTVKIPKDEDTLVNITPFNLRKTGIGTQDFNNLSGDQNIYVYANTETFYSFIVSTDQNYFDRTYSNKFKGQVNSYEIQPYLVSGTTGLLTWIYTINYYNNQIVPNILIKAKRDIPGQGGSVVESLVSDASGTAVFSFISLATYSLEFYDSNETLLFTKTPFVPSTTAYYAKIDLETVDYNRTTIYPVSVSFHPFYGSITASDTNIVVVGIDVNSLDDQISSVGFQIKHNGVSLYSDTETVGVSSGYTNYQNINVTNLSTSVSLVLVVTVITADGRTTIREQAYSFRLSEMQGGGVEWDWKADFGEVRDDLGDMGVLIFVFIACLMVVGYAALNFTGNPAALGILVGIVLGLFTFIGWIPQPVFILMALIGFGSFLVSNRRGY